MALGGASASVGRALGALGAGFAVGAAIHGWSTTKATQARVREKVEEVERSIAYLRVLTEQVDAALRCPLCGEPLEYGAAA